MYQLSEHLYEFVNFCQCCMRLFSWEVYGKHLSLGLVELEPDLEYNPLIFIRYLTNLLIVDAQCGHTIKPNGQLFLKNNKFRKQHYFISLQSVDCLPNMIRPLKQRNYNNQTEHNKKNNLLTILKRIKAKQTLHLMPNGLTKKDYSMLEPIDLNTHHLDGEDQGHIPENLFRFQRNSNPLSTSSNGRNSYNIYPMLEKQQIEKNLVVTRKNQKTQYKHSKKNSKLSKFPEVKSQSTEKLCQIDKFQLKKNERLLKASSILKRVSKLKSSLNVNKKMLNLIPEKQTAKYKFNNMGMTKNKFDVVVANNVQNTQKIKKFSSSIGIHDPILNDLSSWNPDDDQQNSIQTIIF